jgi:hypothetical protein
VDSNSGTNGRVGGETRATVAGSADINTETGTTATTEGGTGQDGRSTFAEDNGFDFVDAAQVGEHPYPDALQPLPIAMGLKINQPDAYPTEKFTGGDGNTPFDERFRYCRRMIHWLVKEWETTKPFWIPAATYNRQANETIMAMAILPLRQPQVWDLRKWIPPSAKGNPSILGLAIQSLVGDGLINQKAWGRGVLLFGNEEPIIR